jgi:branched-chain amino acid transport system permease protein
MGTRRSGYYKTSHAQDLRLLDTRYRWGALIAALAGAAALPTFVSGFVIYILCVLIIATIATLSLNLLTGYAGQISLGHAAFLATGAFTSHYLSSIGLPFFAVIALITLIGAALGALVGAPALRLRGLYLVLGTVAYHYLVVYLVNEYQTTGHSFAQMLTGLQLPVVDLGFARLNDAFGWYYFLGAILIVSTIFFVNLARTRPGRAWIALRDKDLTAAALGINVARYKVLSFSVSSAVAAMAGGLLAYFTGSVSAEFFTLNLAVTYLAMLVIGGAASVLGSFLGAVFVTLLPHFISWLFGLFGGDPRAQMLYVVPSQTVVFGLMMILFLMFEPLGLVGIWNRIRSYFELWPLKQSILTERRR